MKKLGWKTSAVMTALVCTSLVVGGQAYAATSTGHAHKVSHSHKGHKVAKHKTGIDNKDQVTADNTADTDNETNGDTNDNSKATNETVDMSRYYQGGVYNFYRTLNHSKSADGSAVDTVDNRNSVDVSGDNTAANLDQAVAADESNSGSIGNDAASTSTANIGIGEKVIKAGEKYLGTPYQYGASRSSKSTMDCSSFVMWAFKEGAGIDLGRGGARSQYQKVQHISRKDLQAGDLIFFSTRATMKYSPGSIQRIGHVGIYAGNNKILHTYGKGGVTYSDFSGWWDQHFVAAGRVIQ